MLTLFAQTDPQVPPVPGLAYRPDFLTPHDHDAILASVDALPWDNHWQRRVQAYGDDYGMGLGGHPMPRWGMALADRLYRERLTPFLCDRMFVNEYLPGQGIAPHVDYEPYDRTIVSVSLGSACIMDLLRVDGGERHAIWLEPRSVLILDGEARYRWKHGIAARKSDEWNGASFRRERRVSVTLRRKRPDPDRLAPNYRTRAMSR